MNLIRNGLLPKGRVALAVFALSWAVLAFGLGGCAALDTLVVPTLAPLPTVPALPTLTPQALPDPVQAAGVYFDAWRKEEYSAMYAWLSSLSHDAISEEDFIRTHQSIAAAMSLQSADFNLLSALAKEQTAQVNYRITLKTQLVGEIVRDVVMNLSLEGDQWRVEWDRGMILPELSGGNTLWMDIRVPSRGNIYDRSGHALVAQTNAVSLGLIPGQMDPLEEEKLFTELYVLLNLDPEDIRAKMENYQPDWYMPLGEVAADRIEARYEILDSYSGLVMEPYQARYYFDSGIAPQTVGYVSAITLDEVETYQRLGYQQDERVGRMGLERWAETALAGPHGGILYVVTREGKIITRLAESPAQPAQSLHTTLDRDLQLGAQQALEGYIGAIVVMERDTGRILALASNPGFDPNIFEATNYNSGYVLEEILTDPDTPLLNRAAQGQYPLGSVFKIITMAAALESGQYTPISTYYCAQTFGELAGTVRYDWTYTMGVPASGYLTLPEGLMRSCNPWFWHIGLDFYNQDMDTQISALARGFGLGNATGIEQIAEADGNLPDPQNQVDAINLAIGQGDTLVTPLQVARFIAAIGNGGHLLRPQLVESITPPGQEPTYTFQPENQGELPISPETLATVQEAMRWVIADPRGTAYWRFINFPIQIAGKTGTAEAPPQDPHAWFAGYTFAKQADHPDIAIAVVLEHGGEGSVVAAPIFKRMVELYFFNQALTPLPWEREAPTPPTDTGSTSP